MKALPWLMGVAGLVSIVLLFSIFSFIKLWIRARSSGAPIGLLELIVMKWFRGVNPLVIVDARVMAVKSGLPIISNDLETHYLARGNVLAVVRALVNASKAGIELSFPRACAIDLAGRDILEAVKMSVTPKVIDCPSANNPRATIDAVAMNGIQLKAKARVTVRTNRDRLVGGAGEDTVIARVGEGIVTTIGSAASHSEVLANPDMISKTLLKKGLDAGTAYEILSIDIADVDVGENIGAKLQAEQAEADKRVAQAKAEERKSMAIAREQEMRALVEENRAKVVLAEAGIPQAIAGAFTSGHLGVMDFYRMKNIQADTDMRGSIAKPSGDEGHRAR
ncbi:MAG: flotillin-like protein FloA [Planctomycetes bacterium]|nr:flotillin-like protein FloA [Planctomycetota bacterium]